MKIEELNGKTVCVLGYGREGSAMVAALETYAPKAEITIADKNEATKPANDKHWLQIGSGWLHNLEKFDVIIKSPGIPPSAFTPDASIKDRVTNSTQIFLDTIADRKAICIGVTGSKGKSTTSSLITAILTSAGMKPLLLGNIGEPAIAHLKEIEEGRHIVLEMSSYQLADLTVSPLIAVITSLFPEHLDYHGDFETYKEAKKNISRFQEKGAAIFYNKLSPGLKEMAKLSKGKKVGFSWEDAPLRIEETKLLGMHNLSNMAAAFKVGMYLKIPKQMMLNVFREFKGLPHRLEFIGTHGGIECVDDAISTTPESTIAALEALGDRVTTIIVGGQDRGNDFSELGRKLIISKVDHVILFPESGERIRQAIMEHDQRMSFHTAITMDDAVRIAREVTPLSKICLLSTASPSYNMFKNFEEKGDQFKKCIGI